MPKEKILDMLVDNGAEKHMNSVHIAWGAKGSAPEAPGGWVDAGYASIAIIMDPLNGENPDSDHYIHMDEVMFETLVRRLKQIKRKIWGSSSPSPIRGKFYVPETAREWTGYIQPKDRSWIIFLGKDGKPALYYENREESGAVIGEPIVLNSSERG